MSKPTPYSLVKGSILLCLILSIPLWLELALKAIVLGLFLGPVWYVAKHIMSFLTKNEDKALDWAQDKALDYWAEKTKDGLIPE
jgi:hypothetical protein